MFYFTFFSQQKATQGYQKVKKKSRASPQKMEEFPEESSKGKPCQTTTTDFHHKTTLENNTTLYKTPIISAWAGRETPDNMDETMIQAFSLTRLNYTYQKAWNTGDIRGQVNQKSGTVE